MLLLLGRFSAFPSRTVPFDLPVVTLLIAMHFRFDALIDPILSS